MQLTMQKSRVVYFLVLALFFALVVSGCNEEDDGDGSGISEELAGELGASGAWDVTATWSGTVPGETENESESWNMVLTQHDARFMLIYMNELGIEGTCEGRTYHGEPLKEAADKGVKEVEFTVAEDGQSFTGTVTMETFGLAAIPGVSSDVKVEGRKIPGEAAIYRLETDRLDVGADIDAVTFLYYDSEWRVHSTESDTDLDGSLDRATRNRWTEDEDIPEYTDIDSDFDGEMDARTTYASKDDDDEVIVGCTVDNDGDVVEYTSYIYELAIGDDDLCLREVTHRELAADVTVVTDHVYDARDRLEESNVLRVGDGEEGPDFKDAFDLDFVPEYNEVIHPLWVDF